MLISKFSFQDNFRGWKLDEVSFTDFNLLVGLSGVGKTQILDALLAVRSAGLGNALSINGCQWLVEVIVDGEKYCWLAKTSIGKTTPLTLLGIGRNGNEPPETEKPCFIKETITKNGREVVKRDETRFVFDDREMPKLKKSESAVALLSSEEIIAPLHRFLSGIIFSEATKYNSGAYGMTETETYPLPAAEHWRSQFTDLDSLRKETGMPLVLKAYILQENFPDEIERLKRDYLEIFTTVLDMKVGKLAELAPSVVADNPKLVDYLVFGLKEKGVEGWILGGQVSDGMMRTLIHLFELAMAASGSTILIDDFENSLGVNCLPQLTEHFLRRSDLQFIMTSHHPYVINNIPWKYWKLVTRKGSEVTVKDATSIPALNTASSLEKFTQLLNLEEYGEAIR